MMEWKFLWAIRERYSCNFVSNNGEYWYLGWFYFLLNILIMITELITSTLRSNGPASLALK